MTRRWGQVAVLAAGAIALGGRVEIGVPGRVTPPGSGGRPLDLGHDRAGALRVHCLADPPLVPIRSVPIAAPIDRLIVGGRELLAVTDAGLMRWTGSAGPARGVEWEMVLKGGRDYALHADTILRLDGERVEFFHIQPGAVPRLGRSLPVRGSDSSMAVAGGRILLHSVTNRNNFLLTVRSLADGGIEDHWLPVERDFVQLFMDDFEALLAATGRVRAAGSRFVFVPLLDNPVRLIDVESRTVTDFYTLARQRGRVVTTSRTVRNTGTCPDGHCRREVREVTSHRYDRIHADAAFDGRDVWVLASEAPGSRRAVVYGFALDARAVTRAYRLAGLGTAPRALAITGGQLVVAAEDRLFWFTLPKQNPGGGACAEER